MKGKGLSYFYIVVAAVLWGITGLFTKTITDIGFGVSQMNFIRSLIALGIMAVIFLFTDRKAFKVNNLKDFGGFVIITVLGYCAYGTTYVIAINETSVGVAGTLFYTYPAFVLLFSRIMFKEKITLKKLMVIAITFVGCLFVSGVLESTGEKYGARGLILGVLSGISFALYNVLGKKFVGVYSSKTVTFYMFLISVFVYGVFINPVETISKISKEGVWPIMVIFTICISVVPYIAHLKGLEKVEASKASIISTAEPISAMVLGAMVYGESISALKLAGIVFIVGGVCFMSSKIGETPAKKDA